MHLSPRFEEALIYANRLHASQKRKGKEVPYLAHLLAVAGIALEHGATEDEAIAALLHDAVEDQGGEPVREEILRRFGDVVLEIVDGSTDSRTTPKPPWRGRKEAYIAHLAHASPSSCLVCASDKLHNARDLLMDYRTHGEEIWSRFHGGKEGTLWYFKTLVPALKGRAPSALVDELGRVVAEIERLASG
jgi:GTP pyrophosphokinase